MKKSFMRIILFIGFLTLFLSLVGYEAFADSTIMQSIDESMPLIEQEKILMGLNKKNLTRDDGMYEYYKDAMTGIEKIRIFSLGRRDEIELLHDNGKWRIIQIRDKKIGVIANYKDGQFVEYSRILPNGMIAHYLRQKLANKDRAAKKADFYTRITKRGVFYICFDQAKCPTK